MFVGDNKKREKSRWETKKSRNRMMWIRVEIEEKEKKLEVEVNEVDCLLVSCFLNKEKREEEND